MSLHTKYRPKEFEEVIGQDATVKSLMNLFEHSDIPHSFLFCGPSGVGKTTLARIIGTMLEAEVREFDAATTSSVADIRSVISTSSYASLFEKSKLYIIDECHALSKQAWQAFLKTIEEPPDHLYFVFCTTEDSKVPKTVKTRCHSYTLGEVPTKVLEKYIDDLAYREGVGPENEAGISLIARQAHGSVRQALVYMSMCDGMKDLGEIEAVLRTPGQETQIIDLCRSLLKQEPMSTLLTYVKALEDGGYEAENMRITIMMYMKSVFLNSKGNKREALAVLECFSRRCDGPDGMALFCLCIADLCLGD